MQAKHAIYLDSNAGAPLRREVREALLPFLRDESPASHPLANPSSIHAYGRQAKRLREDSREAVAASLGCRNQPEQITFTSSGTEANQLAIRSVLEPLLDAGQKPEWLVSPVEHDSVLQMAKWFKSRGGVVRALPVDSQGAPVLSEVDAVLSAQTALVSCIWVNNETGVITSFSPEYTARIRSTGALLHVDGAQAWGKLAIAPQELGADLVSFSGHKIGALSGTGVLWRSQESFRRIKQGALLFGKQERGFRAGTENLLGIASLGAAARALDPLVWQKRLGPLRDRLEAEVVRRLGKRVLLNGARASRVANTLSFSIEGIQDESLIQALDLAGYCVSAGSACMSGAVEPSHVLLAMGRNEQQATGAVRISLSDELEWEVLEGFVGALEAAVKRILGGAKIA